MKRDLRVLAAAGSLSLALFAADGAFAQKAGGILKVGHFDSPAMRHQSMDRFADDPDAGGKQEQCLEERREILGLTMSVEVCAIRRPPGEAHRKQGHEGGDQVEAGMRGFGEDAQAAGEQADDDFESREPDGCDERGQRRPTLLLLLRQTTSR